ncbi:MAG: VTT domain-containing protein [Pirellulales bacterium]
MGHLLRTAVLIAVALAIPIVPFLWFGERVEATVERWLSPPPSNSSVFLVVVTVLATDVFLPVPSSLVSTLAGTQLSIPLATLASWLGLSLGASLGFGVARAVGRPLAVRLASAADLDRMDRLSERFGPRLLVLFRALPVLAEASVLLFGATRLSWIRFFVPVALANLGIAVAYSILGYYGRTQHVTWYVLAASIALPLLATTMVRWRMPVSP